MNRFLLVLLFLGLLRCRGRDGHTLELEFFLGQPSIVLELRLLGLDRLFHLETGNVLERVHQVGVRIALASGANRITMPGPPP